MEILPTVSFFLPPLAFQLRQVPSPATPSLESPLFLTLVPRFSHLFHSSKSHSWVQSLHHHPQFEKRILNLNHT